VSPFVDEWKPPNGADLWDGMWEVYDGDIKLARGFRPPSKIVTAETNHATAIGYAFIRAMQGDGRARQAFWECYGVLARSMK